MKIEIITLHYINHYGSLLQTYATCRAFAKMGFEPEIIDYVRPNADERIQLEESLKRKGYKKYSLKGIAFSVSKKIENRKRRKFSTRFLKKYVPMTRTYKNYDDLVENYPVADIYVTGSDQTWNSDYNGGVLPAYYLDFAPEGCKKIGYSVSIGMEEFHKEELEQIKKYVMQYDAISVREYSAKKMLEDIGYKKVTHILDPTLVLNIDDWKPLIAKRLVNEKYVVIYRLNNDSQLEEFAEKLAKEKGYKLVRMSYYLSHLREKGKMFYCSEVEEFLSLIYYAEHIVTDSFHCVAFSLNFNKDFFAFYPQKYSTRIKSVLELTETTHRAVGSPEFSKRKINYKRVNDVLEKERDKVKCFIEDNCCV